MNEKTLDVVIIGGGPSGLAAAWDLRHLDTIILESRERLGGRLKSQPRGDYWMNYGGHLFPGAGSNMNNLVRDMGLEVIEIPGLKTAMSFAGKVYKSKRIEAYPLTLPLSIKERVSLAITGLKLMFTVHKWQRVAKPIAGESPAARRERIANFRAGETFRDLLGRPAPRIDEIFKSAARRAAAEPEQQSAGAGVALFGAVWSGKKDNTALNLKGGSGRFGEVMQAELGDRVQLGASVSSVVDHGEYVEVTYTQGEVVHSVRARQVVVATPATTAREIVQNIPAEVDRALQVPKYGSWLGLTMITNEDKPMPYDDIYAMTTPDRSFDMFFNHANPLRGKGPRKRGGSLMCYAGGQMATDLMKLSDDEVRNLYLEEIYELFPSLRGHVVESHVQRWVIGGTYRNVDSLDFEALIEYSQKLGKRIHFAGDYFAPLGQMEVAVTWGKNAAAAVAQEIAKRTEQVGQKS